MAREVQLAVVDRSDLAGEGWVVIDDHGTLWAAVAGDATPADLEAVNEALQYYGAAGLDRRGCVRILDMRRPVMAV